MAEIPKPKQGPREKPKFWPKPKYQKAVLAVAFILKCVAKIGQNKVFQPKQAVSAETLKGGKTEIPKPKQAKIFGRN